MRKINEIIVHCTATKAGQHFDVNDVRSWHLQRKFKDIGYHFLVLLDGTVQQGRPLAEAGAHCTGHNTNSIGVCYVGGLDASGNPADTRTPEQRIALRNLLTTLRRQFQTAVIHGHRDFAAKACPCFNATEEYKFL
ncbi:MAG: N-acetylmuramoyl-L-alanine amidase [Paludibacteraceae bacterium]|nr:N-acetylmuramoyl-L-alanine amidase [Paludibacteraceae bacterium]